MLIVSATFGAVGAAFFWYTFSRPLIKRRGE
jgi:hypothetical protein